MIARAEAKYIRMSASKARLVVALIKGKSIEKAVFILDNTNKGACVPIKKALISAFANANNNKQDKFQEKDLRISAIRIDGGPMLQRYRAATMGRATAIRHRTMHLYIELDIAKDKPAKSETKNGKTAKSASRKKGVKKRTAESSSQKKDKRS
ncbi:MAG: 50S ribosomal protein L22 [Candidatus Omnitrophota bacterium]|nr:50S ribosomal protein L22 [Candidatus Omnitrophota bacterium]